MSKSNKSDETADATTPSVAEKLNDTTTSPYSLRCSFILCLWERIQESVFVGGDVLFRSNDVYSRYRKVMYMVSY